MANQRRYALAALFGPASYDVGQYTPHAGRLRMRAVETGPGMATLTLPYHEERRPPLALPPRPAPRGYQRPPREEFLYVPNHAGRVEDDHAAKKKYKKD